MARVTDHEHPRHIRALRHPWLLSVPVVAVVIVAVTAIAVTVSRAGRPSASGHPPKTSSGASTPAAGHPKATPMTTPTPSVALAPALWQMSIPVATVLITARPALRTSAPVPTGPGLRRVLAPLLADPALAGDRVSVVVADAASGRLLLDQAGDDAVLPASTAKLAVAAAALEVLGPDRRFTTRVVAEPGDAQVVLVGGGDPTLAGPHAVGAFSPGYPSPASLSDLASQTASALRSRGTTGSVRLGYDASLFTGATTAAGWKPTDITEGDIAPVSALEVDEGRPDLGRPPRAGDPAAAAARQFAALLTADGVTVTGTPTPTKAASGQVLAAVASPPVSALIQRMLGRSDNDLAEALSRQIAIAKGGAPTFAGGARAVRTALAAIDVDASGFTMVDGSGLSPLDRARPTMLVRIVQRAVGTAHPELAPILGALPVAAFSGTLQDRFTGSAATAAGTVRAKTGTLGGVVSLAGYLDDAAGRTLVFAVVVNGVGQQAALAAQKAAAATPTASSSVPNSTPSPPNPTLAAQQAAATAQKIALAIQKAGLAAQNAIDRVVAGLVGCGCA